MARKLRVQYSGATYHVINRGGRREAFFKDDHDRDRLLATVLLKCMPQRLPMSSWTYLNNRLYREPRAGR